jgi:hypothetical protein
MTVGEHRLAIPSNAGVLSRSLPRSLMRGVENLLGHRIDVDEWTGLS